jgi:hypothetical protein
MRSSVIELLRDAIRSPDTVTEVDDGVYAIKIDEGIIIAWNRDDALSILSGEMDVDDLERCDVKLDLHGNHESHLPRYASADGLRVRLGNRSALFRFSQWGGQGGMLPSTGHGIGMGPGAGSALSGVDQFGNNIVRQQFDISLEQTRKSREDNDWDRSMETRLQSNELYGHQRNEKDRNLEPYTMTFNERRSLKRRRYLQRRRENVEKMRRQTEDNSVRTIKNIAPDPRHIVPIEFRLKDRRQTADPEPGHKRPYHGPESAFVHFPKSDVPTPSGPTIRIALTTQHNRNTIFDDGGEEEALADLIRPRSRPGGQIAGKSSDERGAEAGLSGLNSGEGWPSISPTLSDERHHDPYFGSGDTLHSLPAGMGSERPVGADRRTDVNFGDGKLNEAILMDYVPLNREPSQGIPFMSPDEKSNFTESASDALRSLTEQKRPVGDQDVPLEKGLDGQHRWWPWMGKRPDVDDLNTPKDPYLSYSPEARLTINAPSGQGVI